MEQVNIYSPEITQYINNDIEITGRVREMVQYNKMYKSPSVMSLHIKKVIFNPPATIVYWMDGCKTVVRCMPGDKFDPEKGIAMAYVRRISEALPDTRKDIKKWVKTYNPPKKEVQKDPYDINIYDFVRTAALRFRPYNVAIRDPHYEALREYRNSMYGIGNIPCYHYGVLLDEAVKAIRKATITEESMRTAIYRGALMNTTIPKFLRLGAFASITKEAVDAGVKFNLSDLKEVARDLVGDAQTEAAFNRIVFENK